MGYTFDIMGGVVPGIQDGDILARVGNSGIRIRALRPSSDPATADAVDVAHRAALRRHGVEGLIATRRAESWLLVAEVPGDGVCCAGIRVDLGDEGHPLPIEQVMLHFGADQLALLRGRFVGGVGEIAGLWVGGEFRRLGLAGALCSAGVAAARRIGLTRLFSLPPLHTRGLFEAEGFRSVRALGDEGGFPYPNDRYRSWAMELDLTPDDEHSCGACRSMRVSREALR